HEVVLGADVVHRRPRLGLVLVPLVHVAVPDEHQGVEPHTGQQEQMREPSLVVVRATGGEHQVGGRRRKCGDHAPTTLRIANTTVPATWATAEAASSLRWCSGTLPVVSPVRPLTAT